MGNGTRTVYTYDADGRVLSITNYALDHVTINSFDAYTYDSLGNDLTETNQDGQWVYSYDLDSQLIGAVFTPNSTDPDGLTSQNIQYAYDSVGNRISQTVNGVTTAYSTNDLNEYTNVDGVTYSYDKDGNLTSTTAGTTLHLQLPEPVNRRTDPNRYLVPTRTIPLGTLLPVRTTVRPHSSSSVPRVLTLSLANMTATET